MTTISSRPRHPGAALTLALALTLGLAACGGGSGTEEQPPLASAALTAAQPGELAAFVQARLRRLDAQGRLSSGGALDGLPPTAVALPATTGAAPPQRSSTLVQEDGVDEPDLIQSDGRFIYTLQPQAGGGLAVDVYERAADGRAVALAKVPLASDGASDVTADGMVLADGQRTLAVVSQRWTAAPAPEGCSGICPTLLPQWQRSSVDVQRVEVGGPASAAAGERIAIDGHLVDSRRIDDTLYVVTRHQPFLAATVLPAEASDAEREAAIAGITAATLLPRLRRNGGAAEPLLSDTDCYLQTGNASTAVELTTITAIDLRSPTLAQTSRCFVGGTEALYMTTGQLYLATTRWTYAADRPMWFYPVDIRTDIHKFALAGGSVQYRATGQVEGHLGWDAEKKSYRMSEYQGDLRVLSFTGQDGWLMVPAAAVAASPARLTVLRERAADRTLQAVATLPNARRPAPIGKAGEQVYAVRFLGERGYVVTFRRTDPLYVLDLSDPADPRTTGELEVAGFSEYLYPLANGLLLGVGRDADTDGRTTGLKVALFDAADATRPSERASLTLGAADSSSALDSSRHGLNLMMAGAVARVALPVHLSRSDREGWQQGLQRLEVDTAAGTLRALGLAGAHDASGYAPLALERSLQIGDTVYYLGAGALTAYAW